MSISNKVCCTLCKSEVSLFNFSKHYNSKLCLKGGKYIIKKVVPRYLHCIYCGKECKNHNSVINHERLCTINPNRQYTPFHDPSFFASRRSSNQYIKARELNLPKPIILDKTREKFRVNAIKNNNSRSYSSKECQTFINTLINEVPQLNDYTLYYHNNPHEYFLVKSDGGKVLYDFFIKELKIIVEYNGVKFHPKSIDDPVFVPIFKNQGTTEEIWIRDNNKIELAKNAGYEVIVCWNDNIENDFQFIKNKILSKI